MYWLVAAAQTIAPNTDAYQTQPYVSERPVTLNFERSGTQVTYVDSYLKTEIIEAIKALWGAEADYAIKVANCESGLNPQAINWNDAKITGMPSQGIFQINRPYNEKLFDWRYNIQLAYYEYYLAKKPDGSLRLFSPWSCAKKPL